MGVSPPGRPPPAGPPLPPGPAPPAQRHETFLDDVALRLGERAAAGQAVHRVKHGVHHDGAVLGPREERRTLGDERQHRQAQVAVQRQGHLRGAESGLASRAGASGPLRAPGFGSSPHTCSSQSLRSLGTMQIFKPTAAEAPSSEPSLPRVDSPVDKVLHASVLSLTLFPVILLYNPSHLPLHP